MEHIINKIINNCIILSPIENIGYMYLLFMIKLNYKIDFEDVDFIDILKRNNFVCTETGNLLFNSLVPIDKYDLIKELDSELRKTIENILDTNTISLSPKEIAKQIKIDHKLIIEHTKIISIISNNQIQRSNKLISETK